MEKIAIISDVHSNITAFKAVVEDIAKRGITRIFCAGDLVLRGSSPAEVVDIAKEKCEIIVKGNADEGGTKVGALFGEAVVITNENLQEDFRYYMKQQGAMLAKGRLLGIQFDVLFENNLYFNISKHAIDMAMKIKQAFIEKEYKFLFDSYTNQQFPIISNEKLNKLSSKYTFSLWERVDKNNSVARFCTSWATKEENVNELIKDIKEV